MKKKTILFVGAGGVALVGMAMIKLITHCINVVVVMVLGVGE